MTIPANLTHTEVGAYLVAIGQHMINYDVCAGAVVDPEILKDEDYAYRLVARMQDAHWAYNLSHHRCFEIIDNLTLEEAVGFVNLP